MHMDNPSEKNAILLPRTTIWHTVNIVIADAAAIEMQGMQIFAFLHYSYCVPKSVYPTKKFAKRCELRYTTADWASQRLSAAGDE